MDHYKVKGDLQNNNPFGVAYVKVNITGYDTNGNLVDTQWTFAYITNIPAGGRSPFDDYLNDPDNKIVRYDVRVMDADKSLYKSDPSTTTDTSNGNSSNVESDNNGDDYDRGFDEGYYDGVMAAYSKEGYDDSLSKSLQLSDMYRSGYKSGYDEGYTDIKKGRSLQKPRLPWNAYLDPRNGQKIQ